jgi:AAA domain
MFSARSAGGVVRVKALQCSGYRNLKGRVELRSPLAVIVGENNAGKSNVIDALRTALEPEAGPRHRCWLRAEDFWQLRVGPFVPEEAYRRPIQPCEQLCAVDCPELGEFAIRRCAYFLVVASGLGRIIHRKIHRLLYRYL